MAQMKRQAIIICNDDCLNANTMDSNKNLAVLIDGDNIPSAQVKEMMEEVIREHLGWLIVWGNVFGALIGLAARALGY